jgi:hypothetical protein
MRINTHKQNYTNTVNKTKQNSIYKYTYYQNRQTVAQTVMYGVLLSYIEVVAVRKVKTNAV